MLFAPPRRKRLEFTLVQGLARIRERAPIHLRTAADFMEVELLLAQDRLPDARERLRPLTSKAPKSWQVESLWARLAEKSGDPVTCPQFMYQLL